MSQGNAQRVHIAQQDTAGAGDVFSVTLSLYTRWVIKPGTVKIYADGVSGDQNSWPWTSGTLVATDDGAGNLTPDPAYPNVTGTVDYATGAIVLNENADNPFLAGKYPWVEYYEGFPVSPADDFDACYTCFNNTHKPLILHRYDHANFADRNLLAHGQYCLLSRGENSNQGAVAYFLLNDPDFTTDRPVMSEIAFRIGNSHGAQGAKLGPQLIHGWRSRYTHYTIGPDSYSSNDWTVRLIQNGYNQRTEYYSPHGLLAPYVEHLDAEYATQWWFRDLISNTPPNILADDWHKIRVIKTYDADPGDVHLHILMAIGHAEVDKPVPIFQTLADVWHQSGNNAPIVDTSMLTQNTQNNQWYGGTPAVPPLATRMGFVLGGFFQSANIMNYCDDFRAFRML